MRRDQRFDPDTLREARLVVGWSRARLGERVAVAPATVKTWETDVRAPKASTQLRLAQVLGLRLEDLKGPSPGDAADLRRLREYLDLNRDEAAGLMGIDLRRCGGSRPARRCLPTQNSWPRSTG